MGIFLCFNMAFSDFGIFLFSLRVFFQNGNYLTAGTGHADGRVQSGILSLQVLKSKKTGALENSPLAPVCDLYSITYPGDSRPHCASHKSIPRRRVPGIPVSLTLRVFSLGSHASRCIPPLHPRPDRLTLFSNRRCTPRCFCRPARRCPFFRPWIEGPGGCG